jgi:TonB-dependent Receptor Plug Domain
MRPGNSLLFLVAVASLAGCVSQPRGSLEQIASKDTIGAEEIARLGFSNAWDLLRARARRYDFYEDRYGRPRGIKTRRGRSTINMADSDTPMILVDGARLSDFGVLRDLPTDAIFSIELLNGISGTVSQGTNAAAGVIYIHTWEASGG